MDKQKLIIEIFQNNLGNRLTVELANGMIQKITEVLNVNNTPTDPSTKE